MLARQVEESVKKDVPEIKKQLENLKKTIVDIEESVIITNGKLEDFQSGGRNYILDSQEEKNITSSTYDYILSPDKNNLKGEMITVSFDAKIEVGSPPVAIYFYFKGKEAIPPNSPRITNITTDYKRYEVTFTAPKSLIDTTFIVLNTSVTACDLYVKNIKLEIGKSSDWTPAIEDIVDKIETNITKLEVAQGKIEAIISENSSIKGEVDTIKNKYSNMQLTIDGLTTSVGEQITTVENIKNEMSGVTGTITTVQDKQSSLQQSLDGFKLTVSNSYATKQETANIQEGLESVVYKMSKTESSITQLSDRINLKAESTDIESAIEKSKWYTDGQITSVSERVSSQMAQIEITTNSITQRVESTESVISSHTIKLDLVDGKINGAKNDAITNANGYTDGTVSLLTQSVNKKFSEIKLTTDSITQRVESTEQNVTTITGNLALVDGKINNAKGEAVLEANGYTDGLISYMNESVNTKFSEIKLTTDSITQQVVNNKTQLETAVYDLSLVDGKIDTAKLDAITSAETDATKKATQAQANAILEAKGYTDGQITFVNETVSSKFSEIKLTTDSITQQVVDNKSAISTATIELGKVDGKINTAKNDAISTAQLDASQKSNQAKLDAILDANNYTDGKITIINEAVSEKFAEIKVTTDSINQKVSDNSTSISTTILELGKVDGKISDAKNGAVTSAKDYTDGKITLVNQTIESKVAEINLTTDGIKQSVSSNTTKIESATTELGKVDGKIDTAKNGAITSAKGYTDGQISTVTESVNSKISEINITTAGISQKVSAVQQDITSINGDVTNLSNRMWNAEQKITSDAIVSTVTSSTTYKNDLSGKADSSTVKSLEQKITADAITTTISSSINQGTSSISTTQFVMDKNGLTIKNGSLSIWNQGNTRKMVYLGSDGDIIFGGKMRMELSTDSTKYVEFRAVPYASDIGCKLVLGGTGSSLNNSFRIENKTGVGYFTVNYQGTHVSNNLFVTSDQTITNPVATDIALDDGLIYPKINKRGKIGTDSYKWGEANIVTGIFHDLTVNNTLSTHAINTNNYGINMGTGSLVCGSATVNGSLDCGDVDCGTIECGAIICGTSYNRKGITCGAISCQSINAGSYSIDAGTISSNGSYVIVANGTTTSIQVKALALRSGSSSNYLEIQTRNSSLYGVNVWNSDISLKENIEPVEFSTNKLLDNNHKIGLEAVLSLEHYKFDYKDKNLNHVDCGYIAQQLIEVNENFAYNVKQEDGSDMYCPDITALIPTLSLAIKEQQEYIKSLEERLKKMEEKSLC